MRVTCVLNACHTRSERGSDACVIELVAGLYRSISTYDTSAYIKRLKTSRPKNKAGADLDRLLRLLEDS